MKSGTIPATISFGKVSASRLLSPDPETWQQKQQNIQKLQEANRSLLKRVQAPPVISNSASQNPLTTTAGPVPSDVPSFSLSPSSPLITAPTENVALGMPSVLSASASSFVRSSGGWQSPTLSQRHLGARHLSEESLRFSVDASALRSEIGDCHRTIAGQEREANLLRTKHQRLEEKFEAAQRKAGNLADQNDRLQRETQLRELLDDTNVTHRTVRNFIEGDLVTIRAERRDAEALLRAEASKWQQKAEEIAEEYRHAVEEHEASQNMFEAARTDHGNQLQLSEAMVQATGLETAQHLSIAEEQVKNVQAAANDLKSRLHVCSDNLDSAVSRLKKSEETASLASSEAEHLRVKMRLAEHEKEQRERICSSELADINRRLHSQEAEAATESQRSQDTLERQRLAALEEKKRLKRDQNKRTNELQVRCGELEGELEEARAKSKDTERGLLSKLSNTRYDRQRLEAKLRGQVEVLSEERRVEQEMGEESLEILDNWNEYQTELNTLKNQLMTHESERAALRQKNAQAARSMRQENEALLQEVSTIGGHIRAEFDEELSNMHKAETAFVGSAREANSEEMAGMHLEQRSEFETELERIKDEDARAHSQVYKEIEVISQHAKDSEESCFREEVAVAELESEMTSLEQSRQDTLEELEEARHDAQGATAAHEALLDRLRKEYEAAQNQFHQAMQQAQDKKRRLGSLQGGLPSDDGMEQVPSPFSNAGDTTTRSMFFPEVGRPPSECLRDLQSLDHLANDVEAVTVADISADGVLRSLTRERVVTNAHRAADKLSELIAKVGMASKGGIAKSESDALPSSWAAAAQRHLEDLLTLFDDISHASAEDEQLLLVSRQSEVQLRRQLGHATSVANLRKMELLRNVEAGCAACEMEAGRIQGLLDEQIEKTENIAHGFHKEAFRRAEFAIGAELKAEMNREKILDEETRAHLECTASENVQVIADEAEENRQAFVAELEELRKALRRELAATRDEHGGLARREMRLESRIDNLRADYDETAEEFREMKDAVDHQRQEFEVESRMAKLQNKREHESLKDKWEEKHLDFLNELREVSEHRSELHVRVVSFELELPCFESELNEAKCKWEEAEAALIEEPERRKIERRNLISRVRLLESEEGSAEHFREELETYLESALERSEQSEWKAKEQLHAAREERMRERHKENKMIERLRSRVNVLEKSEAAFEKQREISERQQLHLDRTENRNFEETSLQLERMKRENRQAALALEDLRVREGTALTKAEETRVVLANLEEKYRDTELRFAQLSADKAAISTTECSTHEAKELMEANLQNYEDTLKASERWGQELSRKLQEFECQAKVEVQEESMQCTSSFGHRVLEAASEVEQARRKGDETQRLLERMRRIAEQETLRLLPLLPPADSDRISQQLREAAYLEFSDEPGKGSETALPGAIQAASRRLDSLSKETTAMTAAEKNQESRIEHLGMQCRELQEQHTENQQKMQEQMSQSQGKGKKSGGRASESSDAEIRTKLAQLQKEVIKLRETNQELRHQQQQQASSSGRSGSPTARSKAVASNAPANRQRSEPAHVATRSRVVDGELHSDLRHKLKQLQRGKAEVEQRFEDLTRHSMPMEAEVQRLHDVLWTEQQEREVDQEKVARTVQTLERRIRLLEAKLKSRAEAHQALGAEKEAVEEQLGVAANQLEALLADESRETDLQKELAELSRQFEQLHSKHQNQSKQLAKAAAFEDKWRESENDALIAKASAKKFRKEEIACQGEVDTLLTERAASKYESSEMRERQQQQQDVLSELSSQIERLQTQLTHAKERSPGVREAVVSSKEKDASIDELRSKVVTAESVEKSLKTEMIARTTELQEMSSDCGLLRHELRNAREEWQHAEQAVHAVRAVALTTPQISASQSSYASGAAVPAAAYASRPSEIAHAHGGSATSGSGAAGTERRPARGDVEDSVCVVTAQDQSHMLQQQEPPTDGRSVLRKLGDIPVSLNPDELEAFEKNRDARRKHAERDGDVAAVTPASIAEAMQAAVTSGAGASMESIERDFADFARSIGYEGDIAPLWAEAQSQAAGLKDRQQPQPDRQQPQPWSQPTGPVARQVPVAADVELKKPEPVAFVSAVYPQSPPNLTEGSARQGNAYPQHPAYPISPGRPGSETWRQDEEVAPKKGDAESSSADESPHSPCLPSAARQVFRDAESCCEQQRFSDAVPRFERVLEMLRPNGTASNTGDASAFIVPAPVVAEVWAHLGVAKQSLDRVREAIDCYKHAVALDPSLHVCFANLATLHAYLQDHVSALQYIEGALALERGNATYEQIRQHLLESTSSTSGP